MTQRNDTQTADLPQRANAFAAAANGQGAFVNPEAASARVAAPAGRTRKAIRIAVALPVEVRDQFGGREETRTQFVMVRGAVLATTSNVRVGHKLTIQNLKNGRVAECHIIGVEPVLREVHQIEVEFTRAQPDFWPVQFPAEDSREFLQSDLEAAKAESSQTLARPAAPSSAAGKVEPIPILQIEETGSSSMASELESSRAALGHDNQIVSLADSITQNFKSSSTFHAQEKFAPRPTSVDSVAQFRAANRAAHQRERRMKALYSILSIAALAGAFVGGKSWLRQHPEGVRASAAPSLQSSMLGPTPASVTAAALNPSSGVTSPAQISEAPVTNPSDADLGSAEQPVVSVPADSTPVETQVAVRHGALASSRKTVEAVEEEPLALPLRAGENAAYAGKPEALNAVVSQLPTRNAVLAPQAPKKPVPAKLIRSVPALYPSMARQIHIEGAVILNLEIDAVGNVTSANAISGAPLLRGAALEAVRRWKYQPATLGDKPVTSSETVKVDFRLK